MGQRDADQTGEQVMECLEQGRTTSGRNSGWLLEQGCPQFLCIDRVEHTAACCSQPWMCGRCEPQAAVEQRRHATRTDNRRQRLLDLAPHAHGRVSDMLDTGIGVQAAEKRLGPWRILLAIPGHAARAERFSSVYGTPPGLTRPHGLHRRS